MFNSTMPGTEPPLMRVSEFRRFLSESDGERDFAAGGTRLTSLAPSVLQDLQRFAVKDVPGEIGSLEALEVMAAAVRHARPLLLHVQHERHVLPLTVFPAERLVHCPLNPATFLSERRITELRVLHVEPARLPTLAEHGDETVTRQYLPLGPLLWTLALHGSREELLPEIAGTAAYRVAPGADLAGLEVSGSLAAAVYRLRRQTTNLRDMSSWPGFDRARAMRLLNGLYLQAALMVSRTHPAATNEGWFSGSLS
jgi:hypothetical protein